MKSVLLVGCGNIGFRHLQALCAMANAAEIVVVEPNSEAADRIEAQFAKAASTPHRFELVASLPEAGRGFGLCVVATAAEGRRAIIDAVLDRYELGALIIEKILFQTIADLDHVGARLAELGVGAFVNCGRRTFAGYQSIRESTNRSAPVCLTVDGQRLGMASNAVHFIDLLEFLNDAPLTSVDVSGLDPGSQPAKRPGCVEVFGTLTAELANGAQLTLTSLDVDPIQVRLRIDAGDAHFAIDELARTVASDDREPGPFASQNVSETVEIYDDAIATATCVLTPYAHSARQHRAFLTAIRDHLGLSNADDVPCPVS